MKLNENDLWRDKTELLILRLSKLPSAKVLLKLEFDTEDQVSSILWSLSCVGSISCILFHRKKCIIGEIRQKLQVPASLGGQKILLFGKPEENKEAKEIVEEELRLVRQILSGR